MSNEVTVVEQAPMLPSMDAVRKVDNFRVEFTNFLKEKMVSGTDYGVIPNTGGKPTLYKPGAEKLLNYFGYSLRLEVAEKHDDHETGYFYYKYKATVIGQNGRELADGYGSANTKEKKWSYKPGWEMANTADKMAQKRAMVAATLSATRASEFYTQDVEDMDLAPRKSGSEKAGERYPEQQVVALPTGPTRITVASFSEKESAKGKAYAVLTDDGGNTYYAWDRSDLETLRGMQEGESVSGTVERSVSNGRSYANISGLSRINERGEEEAF